VPSVVLWRIGTRFGKKVVQPPSLRATRASLPWDEDRAYLRYCANGSFWVFIALATMLASIVAPAKFVCVASLSFAWNFREAA
jgi:hypothetical protein